MKYKYKRWDWNNRDLLLNCKICGINQCYIRDRIFEIEKSLYCDKCIERLEVENSDWALGLYSNFQRDYSTYYNLAGVAVMDSVGISRVDYA